MRDLTLAELGEVSGGAPDAVYAAGVGAAIGFLAMGLIVAAGPLSIGAAIFYGASILSSGSTIYRATQ